MPCAVKSEASATRSRQGPDDEGGARVLGPRLRSLRRVEGCADGFRTHAAGLEYRRVLVVCGSPRNAALAGRSIEDVAALRSSGCMRDVGASAASSIPSIRSATCAAPKPLSMLTTASPDAQLASAAFNAARPPVATPYPTEVGTAMTALATSPVRTLKMAPSMPATTMTMRWARMSSRCSMSRHSPATPTSTKRVLASPWNARVRAASSATGTSDVPPLTMAMRAGPAGSGRVPRIAVRDTSS